MFHLNYKIQKEQYGEASLWANANHARIVREGDDFYLRAVPERTASTNPKVAPRSTHTAEEKTGTVVKLESLPSKIEPVDPYSADFPSHIRDIHNELKAGDVSIRRQSWPVFSTQQSPTSFALIECYFGTDERRTAAAVKAIGIMAESNPKPAEWVIVEAQEYGVDGLLKDAAERAGAKYIYTTIPKKSKDIFIKEALWNIGVDNVTADKLVFLDIDCVLCNKSWAYHVEKATIMYDFGSPHGYAYYAETEGENIDYNKVFMSTGYATMCNKGHGHPGFGVFMSRSLYRHLGEIPCTSSAGADSWLWYRVLGHWRRPYGICRLPYNAPYIYNFGIRPAPKIGATGELLCHIDHGHKSDRVYQAQALIARWSTTMPFEDLSFNKKTKLPEWADNTAGRLHRRARLLFKHRCKKGFSSVEDSMKQARECYDIVAEQEYGAIDADHPLIFSTSLRSGDKYDKDHVLMLRDLLATYCKTPHQLWCFSDTDVPGVHCIPMVSTYKQTPYFYAQIECFRNVYPKNASVFTIDLDCIPIANFTMHRCPEGTIAMGWEQHNWPRNNRCIWNGGTTYFSGDFSFIFDDFMSEPDNENMPSMFAFISSQEFMNGSLYKHGIIPHDIINHVCLEFWHERPTLDVAASTMVHFLGGEKPWNLKNPPSWVPQISLNPHDRRYL